MEELFQTQQVLLNNLKNDFERSMLYKIPWKERAIMLFGARGSGKTTLFLQHLKKNYKVSEALYVTLDDIYFRNNTLVETARKFSQNNGKLLVLDEVHKYSDWSREVKNIYDLIPDVKLLITGSSILELQRSGADLSRRVLNFKLTELSFREFLAIKYKIILPIYSLDDIISKHEKIVKELFDKLPKPLFYFKQYLEWGAYPIFKESTMVHLRLKQTINLIIDVDLPNSISVEFNTLHQLKKLLFIISQAVPFTPNISKLAEQVGCSRPKLYEMIKMLEAARLTYGLYSGANNSTLLNKPEKIYLHNSNLMYALCQHKPEIGTVRETFFINQLESAGHKVNYNKTGDFLINKKFTFEIGGKNKSQDQIKGKINSFLAKDEIEFGYQKSIPLWLFGFMY
ncbi:MAG: ATP-binding protein [Flavobacteriia bacterium]|nr:ATP-binding protein [Flavobacteriia bacterium]